jgi:hypothetical protein
MSDERPAAEPSADDVEALVRAIAAKDAAATGGAATRGDRPSGPAAPAPDGPDHAPPRPVVVV